MHPLILNLGPVGIHSYGVAIAVGGAASAWFCSRRTRFDADSSVALRSDEAIAEFSSALTQGQGGLPKE